MRLASSFRPFVAALLVPVLATGCASLAQQREAIESPSSQVVTNEPPSSGAAVVGDQPPFEEGGSEIALGAARLVANDGRWSDVIDDDPIEYAVICRGSAFGARRGPLTDGGMYRSFEPRADVGSWVFVGLALGGDGIGPAVYGGSCGSAWIDHSLGTYTGRLAPEIAGRDTSLLFTRTRRTLAGGAGAGAAGELVERLLPIGSGRGEPGRTAKPRAAQPAGAAPATTPAASGSGSAAAASPKSSAGERSGGDAGSAGANASGGSGERRVRPRGAF
jgi:hypothetical protein